MIFWTWDVVLTPLERADLILLEALNSGKGIATAPLAAVSRNQLKRMIDDGRVEVDGKKIKSNQKLKVGAHVRIEFPPPEPMGLTPENRPLDVLFEDEHLVVINKPAGLTVHPSSTQKDGTLVHALLHHIEHLSGIGGVLRPGIVHRIDKDTSGALVITKTDLAHTRLSLVFSKHKIERAYWALCYGVPVFKGKAITEKIESLIGRSPQDRKKMSMKVKEGRHAVTYIKKLQEFGVPAKNPFASWVEATLETGRTHQVRVHLTGIGHSLLGDPVYGVPSENQPKWQSLPNEIKAYVKRLPGQALHARVLGFEHPITHQYLRFEADPPQAFRDLLEGLKSFSGS